MTGQVVHVVARGDFEHWVTKQGEIESGSNDELRCQVRAGNVQGTVIVEILPEGTAVRAGDVLVRFDSAALESERQKQLLACNVSAAKVTKSENALKKASVSKREYEEGLFKQDEQADVLLKEENLRLSEKRLQHSERIAKKGYISESELEVDRIAVEKAATELEASKTKLHVLHEFTREKKLLELQSESTLPARSWNRNAAITCSNNGASITEKTLDQ